MQLSHNQLFSFEQNGIILIRSEFDNRNCYPNTNLEIDITCLKMKDANNLKLEI